MLLVPVQVLCLVRPSQGSLEVGSSVAGGRPRAHFYAIRANTQKLQPLLSQQPQPSLARLVQASSVFWPVGRQALATVALPENNHGFGVHPAATEASLVVSLAAQRLSRSRPLRVAATIGAVLAADAAPDGAMWAAFLTAAIEQRSSQRLIGDSGTGISCIDGVETRRLVTNRPAVMTPRWAIAAFGCLVAVDW